ncbi:hypothetical protein AB1N83_012774 [Pleurotus pulmonarius]
MPRPRATQRRASPHRSRAELLTSVQSRHHHDPQPQAITPPSSSHHSPAYAPIELRPSIPRLPRPTTQTIQHAPVVTTYAALSHDRAFIHQERRVKRMTYRIRHLHPHQPTR